MRRNPTSGLSLLETLVGLAVLAFLTMIGLSLLSSSNASLQSVTRLDDRSAIALGRADLRDWLEHAIAPDASGPVSANFSGDEHHLEATTILDDGAFWPGDGTTILLSSDSPPGGAAALARGLADKDQAPLSRRISLAAGADPAGLRIAYFGQAGGEDGPGWHDRWAGSDPLPRLVRIEIAEKGFAYPPLIIRPGSYFAQREMSLSSLLPPDLPSRP